MEDVRGLFLGGLALRRISIGLIVICVALLLVLKADIRRVLPKMICAGAALFFAVCGFNFTGEGLRAVLDPKSGVSR